MFQTVTNDGRIHCSTFAGLGFVLAILLTTCDGRAAEVVVARQGQARMPIVAGSVAEPVAELRHYLTAITGAEFEVVGPDDIVPDRPGLFVGLARDFTAQTFEEVESLGPEGFLIRSDERNLYLIGQQPLGVQHAVVTFLQDLGCRWFFPGEVWEVVPRKKTISGEWHQRQRPDFSVQRRIWPGFGLYGPNREQWDAWDRHNRMGGPVPINIHHSWTGLNPESDFEQHPEWFALVDGRRQPTKPCYSHPEVIRLAVQWALAQAETGSKMITLSAPDGLGFCECPRCLAVLQGGKPFKEHSALWGRRPDGTLVNVTSETLFHMVNEVAAAVAKKHPETLVGCYAYSAYSHPPSFDLQPNIYIQTTTAFRRTSLTLGEQLAAFGAKTRSLGIREYYSVYQWDWDEPYPGRVRPDRLQKDLRFFRENGVTALNAEASNNWAPRGLGYYLAAQLLWDVDADVHDLVRDFYQQAFSPAAEPIERYYVRWYGPCVSTSTEQPPAEEVNDEEEAKDPAYAPLDELREAFQDLDEAARLVRGRDQYEPRVDHLRMYVHYLLLRHRLREAAQGGDRDGILAAIEAETVFGGRLVDTNMIHTRPLVGKAFLRRFRRFEPLLAELPEENREGKLWRSLGTAPGHEELEQLWAEDKELLKMH